MELTSNMLKYHHSIFSPFHDYMSGLALASFLPVIYCKSHGKPTDRILLHLEGNSSIASPSRMMSMRVTYDLWTWISGRHFEPYHCVTRAPLLYFIRSWVALSFNCESVSQASVTPVQISTFCNILRHECPLLTQYHQLPTATAS